MTDGRSGKTASIVSSVVGVLLLVGTGSAAYSNLNSIVQDKSTRVQILERDVKGLDDYDARLSGEIDTLKDRMVRSEAEQDAIKRNQQRIEFTMGEILREMKQMNENIIRLGMPNGNKKRD